MIETPKGPVVVDLNYFPGYKGVPNAAPLIADYIEHYARKRINLKLPQPALPVRFKGQQELLTHANETIPY